MDASLLRRILEKSRLVARRKRAARAIPRLERQHSPRLLELRRLLGDPEQGQAGIQLRAKNFEQLPPRHGIQVRGGFVRDQDVGLGRQSLCQQHQLLLARREQVGRALEERFEPEARCPAVGGVQRAFVARSQVQCDERDLIAHRPLGDLGRRLLEDRGEPRARSRACLGLVGRGWEARLAVSGPHTVSRAVREPRVAAFPGRVGSDCPGHPSLTRSRIIRSVPELDRPRPCRPQPG